MKTKINIHKHCLTNRFNSLVSMKEVLIKRKYAIILMFFALITFVVGTCLNFIYLAALGTIIPISVWFWEAYQNYNQQKETEQIFLDASKKIDEIEKNLDNNEDTNKQFSEIKKTLTWRILN